MQKMSTGSPVSFFPTPGQRHVVINSPRNRRSSFRSLNDRLRRARGRLPIRSTDASSLAVHFCAFCYVKKLHFVIKQGDFGNQMLISLSSLSLSLAFCNTNSNFNKWAPIPAAVAVAIAVKIWCISLHPFFAMENKGNLGMKCGKLEWNGNKCSKLE